MRCWVGWFALVAGCGYAPLGHIDGIDTDAADAAPAIDARTCFGTVVTVCFAEVPAEPVVFDRTIDLDTDTSPLCNAFNDQAAQYCVIAGRSVAISATGSIGAQGSKPLVLVSASTFELQGVIDATSYHFGSHRRGAGANPFGLCNDTSPTGSSGGAGGSFAGKGGDGAAVNGVAGQAGPAGPPTQLRGGCAGGSGGATSASAAPGGSGGGAVAILASEIHIDGKLVANGAGGQGGPAGAVVGASSGGGGGGAGGMIVLDAPTVTVTARSAVSANGGGGGQGGAGPGAGQGAGADGHESPNPGVAAQGGSSGVAGGDGGMGAATSALDGAGGANAQPGGGGGGGGGGAGYIHAPGVSGSGVSPPPQRAAARSSG